MKIEDFSFIGSFDIVDSIPNRPLPEVAFLGRSNAGKSSVINTLLGSRRAAVTSRKPGRTRNLGYFLVNNGFYFVDMPGYGYAKVSKEERNRWSRLIDRYLERQGKPEGAILVLDVRRVPDEEDRAVLRVLRECGVRHCLVFNKTDKIGRNALGRKIVENIEALRVDEHLGLVPFSCKNGRGKRELLAWISSVFSLFRDGESG